MVDEELLTQLDIANYEISKLSHEIDRWKSASGLECGGDPDGVTPEAAAKYWRRGEDRLVAALDLIRKMHGCDLTDADDELNKNALLMYESWTAKET